MASTKAAQAFNIRRPKTLIGRPRRFVDQGFEIGGLLDKADCNVRVWANFKSVVT
jgi:hypothetical protein